ncbi:CLUMA_CG020077, isoform A [Clunio marinus]|uniref:CLUMA_CG020077, isoform A n=1 Tax=Clunio marinus TaxID=568069 RepID=A0A1J1J809_9DIPT|nr:CLUMA_CG020077, isoform A [Clunio marinus]
MPHELIRCQSFRFHLEKCLWNGSEIKRSFTMICKIDIVQQRRFDYNIKTFYVDRKFALTL